MSVARKNAVAAMALLFTTTAIAFLLWRGLRSGPETETAPLMAWREADETDLF